MSKIFYNKDEKIWHGQMHENLYDPNDTIGSLVLEVFRKNTDDIAQISHPSGKTITFGEMYQLSVKVAKHLEKLQLQQGDFVGIIAGNSDYVAPVFFGAMFRGLCVCSLDPSFDKAAIKHIYSMSRPKIIFCDGDIYQRVRDAFDECGLRSTIIYTLRHHLEGIPNVLSFFGDDIEDPDYRVQPLKNASNQLAIVLCTSGTTGLPKCICISHKTFLHMLPPTCSRNERILCFSNLYWMTGVTILALATLGGATRIISENPFKVDDFFEIVKLYKVTFMCSFPAQIPLCLASSGLQHCDLSSLRVIFIAGSAVSYAMAHRFQTFAPNSEIVTGYGMTEICGVLSGTIVEPTNSVGILQSNREVKIINKIGQNQGPNERGEVCVRTKFPCLGYLTAMDGTRPIYDEDGWFHSGDIGYFNEEGKLYIVDRRTDILKYNNFHYSPTDIEMIISELPEVASVCVVGIADDVYDTLPAAAVIRRPDSIIKKSDIYEHVCKRMQNFEYLRGGVFFVENWPLTPSGKIMRREVKKMCENFKTEEKL